MTDQERAVVPADARQNQALRAVAQELDRRMATVAVSAAAGITPDRLRAVALSAFTREPKLWQCDPVSVARSIVEAAQLGLEPTGLMGGAYLVPYRNHGVLECQLLIGYRGLVMLARRSGEIARVEARVVHERDLLDYEYGASPRLKHVPTRDRDSGPVTHAYAVAFYRDQGTQFDVMNLDEIEAIRTRSRAKDSGPWVTDYEEMAKKTPLRRLAKLLPLTIEVQEALDRLDPEVERAEPTPTPAEPRRVQQARQAVQDRLAGLAPGGEHQLASSEGHQVAPTAQPTHQVPQEAPSEPLVLEPEPEEPLASPSAEPIDVPGVIEPTEDELEAYEELATNGGLSPTPVAVEPLVKVCHDPSPWTDGHFCILEPGHAGNHRSGNRESWAPKR